MWIRFFYLFVIALLLNIQIVNAQKVGVVLSGGGSSGLAHIGVLKALEEYHVPIDYISGTSIGALIGGMYAVGYSPQQMEDMVKSENFRKLAYGDLDSKYNYYFKKVEDNAAWLSFKFSPDSSIITALPTSIISPLVMDYSMMEIFAAPSAASHYDFDSLLIPFRCVASDIERKQSVVFNNGDLGEAIRSSLSYPFYIKPITVNGRLLFDGGLYNNFPADVMYDHFFPDIIIGSSVSGNVPPPNEDNLYLQVRNMLTSKSNYSISCPNGILIEPKANVGLYDFDNVQQLIDSGYYATVRQLEKIRSCVIAEESAEKLKQRREVFRHKQRKIVFDNIFIEGLNQKQTSYVQRILFHKKKQVTLEELKSRYFRLAADNKIKQLYPKARYNAVTGFYDLYLAVKKEKDIVASIGGNFSNEPISEGFIGIQYNYLSKVAVSTLGNVYFGKLYNSMQVKLRFDFPYVIPFYVEPSFTFNSYDYYRSNTAIYYQDTKPAYLLQREQLTDLCLGFPFTYRGKFMTGASYAAINSRYYQTDHFTQLDTVDRTDFNIYTVYAALESNSLNRRIYANEGGFFKASAKYIYGQEINIPGSTSMDTSRFSQLHSWLQTKCVLDKYYKQRGRLRLGVYLEGVFSFQDFFNNYTATILTAPAFQPTPHSKTLFLPNYRAHQYAAGGLKAVMNVYKSIELRLEGYIFQPFQSINQQENLKASYGKLFAERHYIGMGALVYQSPVGPLSLSVNYYDQPKNQFSFLFHFGYIIFNKKSMD